VSPALLVFNPSSGTLTVNNTVDSGTRNTLFHSGGTVVLNHASNSWAEAQIQYGSKVKLGVDDAMVVSKRVIFGNTSGGTGTIDINGFNQTIGGVQMYGTAESLPDNLIRNTHATETGTFTVNQLTVLDQTFSGRIIEAVNLVKDGVSGSSLTLTGTNTFTGTTVVDGGSLVLGNEWALQNSTLNHTNANGTLSFGSGFTEFTLGGLSGTVGMGLTNQNGAAVELIVGNNNSDTTYSGVLSAGGNLTKIGAGKLTLAGENTFSGTTTLENGTLAFGCDNALSPGSQVVLNGGTLDPGSYTNTLGQLNVTGPGTIDLGDGSGRLAFANSSGLIWSGTLTIAGDWLPYTLRVGTDASGLTKTQLKNIEVNGSKVWVQIDSQGYLWQMNGTLIIIR